MMRLAAFPLDGKWLQWAVRRAQYRLGWSGMALAVLLMAAVCLVLGWLAPLRGDIVQLQQELQAQEAASRLHPQPQRQAVTSPEQVLAQELAEFDARFPDIQQLPDELAVLFRLAEQHGLQVVKGEYSLSEKKQGSVRRFEASVPVQGSYQSVKALVLAILDALPNVALAELGFERGEAVESEVKTRLRLVFFIRKQGV
ncbi:hypothetical protein [Methylobacillus sp.]|uniref:hypothetical protein n=1 Tax=Methylobacillus sp. TaxID=56818 RepID=UPI0012C26CCB|nr:hypothetical protein [Methylobacillus sp.]MPS47717.1 hypothetical protein [Methylobacillus sp.]